jgi:hypothetical protein
MTGLPGEL